MEILSVSQLTGAIREMLETGLGDVWVEGEVSNLRQQTSGHRYFTIKDAQAQLSCVFFRGHAWNNRTVIRDGAKLRLFGTLSLYEIRGQVQLVVREARPAGAGDLHERFEALKAKLRAEGLFEDHRKRPLPAFPLRVGIVTSPTGAVIRDLLTVFERRAPWVEILLFPARVQGDGAYLEIVEGLEFLGARQDVDLVILARGGGSLEDLWSFNEEAVARAVARCRLPVICAVGHETDFSIADFVADLRAPTPSAAAELATPDQREMQMAMAAKKRQMAQTVERRLGYLGERLEWMRREGAFQRPRRRLQELSQRLDEAADDLREAAAGQLRERRRRLEQKREAMRWLSPERRFVAWEKHLLDQRRRIAQGVLRGLGGQRERLAALRRHLGALGPDQTLARGYSILLDEAGAPITSVGELSVGKGVRARVIDGEAGLVVTEVGKRKKRGKTGRKRKPK